MVNLELSFFAVDIEKFDFKIEVKVCWIHGQILLVISEKFQKKFPDYLALYKLSILFYRLLIFPSTYWLSYFPLQNADTKVIPQILAH